MIYFLIGMPGSGKSTLGKELAAALSYQYIDLDELIEQREAKTIPEIFSEEGQTYFRLKETEALLSLTEDVNAIVSTGGGAPCFNNNMAVINEKGRSIFIEVSIEELFKRLKLTNQNRPLVQGLSDEELFNKLATLAQERHPYYSLSNFQIKGDNISATDLIELLEKEAHR